MPTRTEEGRRVSYPPVYQCEYSTRVKISSVACLLRMVSIPVLTRHHKVLMDHSDPYITFCRSGKCNMGKKIAAVLGLYMDRT